jgi:6,7-dimethyl-8-ribityllumazine synthase
MADFTLGIPEQLKVSDGTRIGVVVSRWNNHITGQLLQGALQRCTELGMPASDVDVFWCPGAFEIPITVRMALDTGRYNGIIALGAVIRGETPHFDYVAGAASDGVMQVMLETRRPVIFGVLTVDTEEQAQDRARIDRGNKGGEAAVTLLEMLALEEQITS